MRFGFIAELQVEIWFKPSLVNTAMFSMLYGLKKILDNYSFAQAIQAVSVSWLNSHSNGSIICVPL